MSGSATGRDDLRRLLVIPDFRRLWIGQGLSDFGDSVTIVSLMFLVERLTGSPAELAGLVGTVVSTILVVRLTARLRKSAAISVGFCGAGHAVAIITGVGHLWQLATMLLVVGSSATPVHPAIETLSQTQVGHATRGRVGGAFDTIVSLATVGSMAVAGRPRAPVDSRLCSSQRGWSRRRRDHCRPDHATHHAPNHRPG